MTTPRRDSLWVRAISFALIYGLLMVAYRVVIKDEPFVRSLVITAIAALIGGVVFAYVTTWIERRPGRPTRD